MSGPTCPLCAGATRVAFTKAECTVRRCGVCDLWFTEGEWNVSQAHQFYGPTYFTGHEPIGYTNYSGLEAALRATAERRLRRVPRGERLLDLGSGPGKFAEVARRRFNAISVDISMHALRTARARGLDVVVSDGGSLPFASGTFDVVTMWDTIEHLSQPVAALREIHRILRPGGLLMLSTGDVNSLCKRLSGRHWHLFTLPEHRYFFSPATLDRLLGLVGLERRAIYHDGAYYSVSYLIERLVKSFGGSTRPIDTLLRQSWLLRAYLPINLFDIVTVHATKPADRRPSANRGF